MIGRLKGKLGAIAKSFAFMADNGRYINFRYGQVVEKAVMQPDGQHRNNLLLDDIGKRVRRSVRESVFLL